MPGSQCLGGRLKQTETAEPCPLDGVILLPRVLLIAYWFTSFILITSPSEIGSEFCYFVEHVVDDERHRLLPGFSTHSFCKREALARFLHPPIFPLDIGLDKNRFVVIDLTFVILIDTLKRLESRGAL